ncbi:MAG: NAD(P)-dependent oxidoreductase [Halopseudomonas aestusnigri]
MTKILLTGAAGMLGKVLREQLNGWKTTLRVSDIADLGPARENEEVALCDLADMDAVQKLVEGCDGIIHLGGVSTENTFENILNANIRGTYNIYEAARKAGVPRILFASSNHTIGFHERETRLDANAPMRPDSLYGVSKCFGESLSRYYYDKFAIETACVRIGSSFPKPLNRRMLATWLSFDDLTALVKQIFEADRLGHAIVYGVSANKEQWWDNHLTTYIGWSPKDSSEQFENDEEFTSEVVDRNDPAVRYQGGGFAAAGHFED